MSSSRFKAVGKLMGKDQDSSAQWGYGFHDSHVFAALGGQRAEGLA